MLAELQILRQHNFRQKVHVDDSGNVVINKTMDVEPILDGIAAFNGFLDKHAQRKASQRYLGALDPYTAQCWARECGAQVGTKEFAEFAIKRITTDIDYRKFKADYRG